MSTTPAPSAASAPEAPKSLFDKLGAAMPIALAALATVFAGKSTSELQRAMFFRTAAGQDQAKATNQWTFAGLKRNRSLIMQGAEAQMASLASFKKASFVSSSDSDKDVEKEAMKWLSGDGPPREKLTETDDEALKALLKAIRDREPEADILNKAGKVKQDTINKAIDTLEKEVEVIDTRWDGVVKAAGKIVDKWTKDDPKKGAEAQAALFGMEQRRYRSESFFLFRIGDLYEARVRVVTAISDKHRRRSENFFYAMLVAQIGAVVSSLALARRQNSSLWLIAGLAGAVAVGFGAFVQLMV